MDNIDEGMIKLTNHNDHPTNKAYKVFFFYKKEESDYFKKNLEEENIFFEYGEDQNRKGEIFLFGVRKTDNLKVSELNYKTLGKFRDPFIKQKWAQYLVIFLSFFIVLFAIISFYKNKQIF
ncbi:hypothetical protein OA958_01675 [Bacteroidota bacterium]|nr:hypothetical protein [Bacteroidota bacterium]PDH46885.1 MAG: hypothetical protein CND37_05660 [Bacteroidetes bacterium MED-G20]|tara:strand:+ start:766 stop:1128 length:363 start_codon:yes stop_codon:yes gene_type:complete